MIWGTPSKTYKSLELHMELWNARSRGQDPAHSTTEWDFIQEVYKLGYYTPIQDCCQRRV